VRDWDGVFDSEQVPKPKHAGFMAACFGFAASCPLARTVLCDKSATTRCSRYNISNQIEETKIQQPVSKL